MKKYLGVFVALFMSLVLAPLASYNASALSFGIDVTPVSSGFRSHFYDLDADQTLDCITNCTGISSQTYPVNVRQIGFQLPAINYFNGDIVQVFFSLENSTRNNSLDSIFRTPITAISNWEFLDYSVSNLDASSASIVLYFRATANNTDRYIWFSSYPNSVYVINDLNEKLLIGTANVFAPINPNAGTSAIVNAIQGQTDYSQAISNVENSIDGLSSDIADSSDAIIENQNRNAEAIQNALDDDLKTCRDSSNLSPVSSFDLTQSRQTSPIMVNLPAGSYSLSYDIDSVTFGTATSARVYSMFNMGTTQTRDVNTSFTSTGHVSVSFTIPSDSDLFTFRIPQVDWNNGVRAKGSNVMLNTGSSPLPYEPYGEDICKNEADIANDEYNKVLEDEAKASNEAGGFSFNFSLPNPLSIFNIPDGCVNTPTIDGWLYLQGDWRSPHCPVFPSTIRNVLTPVVTLFVTLATFLAIIRWVSNSSTDVASDVGLLNSNKKGGK